MDIGSISTKGVVLGEQDEVIAEGYLWTEGDPVGATRRLMRQLSEQAPDVNITAVGTTGSARRLVGAMLGAGTVKNEITAHAAGALLRFPKARTILEIGGQDSKIIVLDNGIVSDYAMNTLCAAGTGAFLSSQARRLGVEIEEMGDLALKAERPARIAARCTVFAESDLVHKAQTGYGKEELIAGLCRAVAANFLNNVAKGKKIQAPIVFQGGVSKNTGVVRAFMEELGSELHIDADSHLMGAVGAAVLARSSDRQGPFRYDIAEMRYETSATECEGCANRCELVRFIREGETLDVWGSKCGKMGAASS